MRIFRDSFHSSWRQYRPYHEILKLLAYFHTLAGVFRQYIKRVMIITSRRNMEMPGSAAMEADYLYIMQEIAAYHILNSRACFE